MQRTVPAGQNPYFSFTRSDVGADAEWTFDLTVSWAEYSKWVAERLAPEYSCKVDPGALLCHRTYAGDSYTLTLRASGPGAASVRAVFIARPS